MEIFLSYFLIILFVIVISVSLYYKKSYNYWRERNVPTIKPNFPFGNFSSPIFGKEGFTPRMAKLYKQFRLDNVKFGGLYAGATPFLLAVHPDFIKDVLSKDFEYFSSHGVTVNEKEEPLLMHLFNMDGQKWKDMRIKLTPTFTSGKMKMMFHTLLDCGKQMEEYIDNHYDKNKLLDIKEISSCYTTDVIGSCAFGLECNSFKNPDAEFRTFGRRSIMPSLRQALRRYVNVISPFLVKLLKLNFLGDEEHAFFLNVVKDMVHHRKVNNVTRNDFMQLLINIEQEANLKGEKAFTIEQIAAQSFLFFLAGFETSSTTMSFCLYELAHHQDIQNKLREEINRVLKIHQGNFTYEAIMEMKYLEQIIKETLRKYPPLPILGRVCTQNYQLPNGTIIEKGVKVLVTPLGLQRDDKFFPHAESFIPERFSDENKHNVRAYTFLPFGEGPRICIGLRFGMMQTKVGLCMLLKNYKLFPGKDTKYPLELEEDTLVLANKGPILLRCEKL